MRSAFLHAATAAMIAFLPLPHKVEAGERPLIWEFTRNAPSSYTARFGSRLPIGAEAGMGGEIGVRGADLSTSLQPVTWWAMVKTEGKGLAGTTRTTRFDLRSSQLARKHTFAVNNVLYGRLGPLDTQFAHNLAFDRDATGSDRIGIRTTRSIRLSSSHTGGVLVARASRTRETDWVTSIGFEQPVNSVRFSATVEEPGRHGWRGRIGASYRKSW